MTRASLHGPLESLPCVGVQLDLVNAWVGLFGHHRLMLAQNGPTAASAVL